ncbi:MAG: PP2C family protein-serine/threonine phosphatase [Oscillospiraceae bacterium]|nr:PP2C family protein-serine/threonine phosphatase [Oscillospiraceae bacterium]
MRVYEKIKTRRGTIAGRSIRHLVLLGIFLVFGVGIIAGQILYTRNLEIYTEYTYSFAHLVADNISGIAPTKFLETETKDPEYFDIRYTLMTAGIYEHEIKDFYLVVPTEEDLIYISEIYHNQPEDEEPPVPQAGFLEHRDYRPGEKEIMQQVLGRSPTDPEELYIGLRQLGDERLATALVPLRTMVNEVPALVGVDVSIAAIWVAQMNLYVMLALTIIVLTSIGIIFHYLILKRTMIRPIQSLKQDTDQLVEMLDHDEVYVSDVRTGDELEALAHSVEEMDRNLKHYVRENAAITAERERLNTELALAAGIQADMLPGVFPPFPDRKEFELYAVMDPAREVGGDFYDFFLIDEDHLGLGIADVSGKGIPAALFMMKTMTLLRSCVLAGLGPKQALEQLNDQIAANNSESMFVTVWLGILEISTGRLTAVNAGHEYPILKSPEGCYELLRDRHGVAAGGMEGICYREYELQLEPGSILFVYSDGLPEANDPAGRLFGTDRVLRALNSAPGQSPEETMNTVRAAVDAFVGDAEQFDDLTMLCLAYAGPGEKPAASGTGEGDETHG